MNKKIKTFALGVTLVFSAATAFALQTNLSVTRTRKDQVSNKTPIVTDITFNEVDPVFTNWVGSSEFKTIPRMTTEPFKTEYAPGQTNDGQRTSFYVGGAMADGSVKKEDLVMTVQDTHSEVQFEMQTKDGPVAVKTYKSATIDEKLAVKAGKVDLTTGGIGLLDPETATNEDVVNAMKALAEKLGSAE